MPADVKSSYYQDLLQAFLSQSRPYPSNRHKGQGIVICGGGKHYFPNVWVCVNMLRHLGCSLPIELWYLGKSELSEEMKSLLEPLVVNCINAFEIAKSVPVNRLFGWELKPYALINSSFEEVLYLDADNVVIKNPEYLFLSAPYQESGAVFWPDRYPYLTDQAWLKREAWVVCRVPYRREPEFESGQMLIHKQKSWNPLQLTMHLNEHSDFYYQYFYGDKDTYHLAWRKLHRPFSLIPFPPKDLYSDWTMIQHDFSGEQLFQHRCGAKWSIENANINVPGFLFEKECVQFLESLKKKWSGEVRRLPQDFTPAERKVFELLSSKNTFTLTLPLRPEAKVQLRPNLQITIDDSTLSGTWDLVENHHNQVILKLAVRYDQYTFRSNLYQDKQGVWKGSWSYFRNFPAILIPQ